MLGAPDKDVRAAAERSDGAAVLRGLDDAALISLLNRLTLFAARRYDGRLNAEELAMQAVADVLAGVRRSWDTDYPPFNNLCWIVRSIASNQLQKEKRLLPFEPDAEACAARPAPSQPPVSELYETDETRRGLRDLLRRAADDDLSRRVVETALEEDRWKPKELAAALNVGEADIYEARRRIGRRLGKLLKSLGVGVLL